MATKKTKKAAQEPQMTEKEREALRREIKQLSEISPEELVEMLRKDQNGQLAVSVTLDALWPKFRETFDIHMPKKAPGTSQKQYEASLENYRQWTKRMKGIAKFWYLCGTVHSKNIEEIISILSAQPDAKAPEEAPEK